MPRGDATGPYGAGPATGQGSGRCVAGFGRGRAVMGFCPGFGFGHRFGWGRGFGGPGLGWGYVPTKKDQQKMLSDYIRALEEDLADAKEELKSLSEE